ncbi:hypothetical protein OsI_11928 [Oryza sativa Indica Group]|uniref:SWIM-type domain-containing protein n=1 Tax=Oryza sativa subsp. indica TaxID=39946 RepID=B8AQY4_ORYSI|nr:hypothetical protein OsI_11928 [Oryza sativa Indica Group]
MATQGWVADRLGDWLKNNPKKGAKDARGKLQEQYEIKLKYSKAWSGVMKQLNDATSLLKVVKITRSDDGFAEVTLVDTDNKTRRHIVDLDNQKCSCRAWQITGKPCRHALAWICSSGGRIQDFVSPYYSVQMFRTAYAGRVPPMTDRTQWPVVDLGFKVHVPKQKRGAGRPRVQRIRGFLEPGRKRVKCKRCKRFGHFEKT